MPECLICGSDMGGMISFGKMPIANGFLTSEEFQEEYFFDLEAGFCPGCTMMQLTERVDPRKLFHDEYVYFSSISVRMAQHFERLARAVTKRYLTSVDPFVVEIGSNDGIMLRHFAESGVRHLGVEPSANVARIAAERGINTMCEFFGAEPSEEIRERYGRADAILAANVVCHIPDLHSVAEGIGTLLKPEGVFIFEDPYLGDIVEKTAYDQIYDEHVYYFSLSSVSSVFGRHGLEVVDVEAQPTHGGSMRYTLALGGARTPTTAVAALREREEAIGLHRVDTFERLRMGIERSRAELCDLLADLRGEGKRIVGYGATSKSTTVLNFCGIGPDTLEFISDTMPTKQGKYTPGTHIPVRPYEEFVADYPDYALLFAWNHGEEILAKEGRFIGEGGKFIVYVPSVQILAEAVQ